MTQNKNPVLSGALPPPEFSVPVELDLLPEDGETYALSASDEERSALAARFGILGIDLLAADVSLNWAEPEKVLFLHGTLKAEVTQTCVVTLEPVRNRIEESIELTFARDTDDVGEFVDPEEAEPLDGDILDLGEIVAEELSLSLDPYPRSPNIDESALELGPGVTISSEEGEKRRKPERANPFEVLAKLKTKD